MIKKLIITLLALMVTMPAMAYTLNESVTHPMVIGANGAYETWSCTHVGSSSYCNVRGNQIVYSQKGYCAKENLNIDSSGNRRCTISLEESHKRLGYNHAICDGYFQVVASDVERSPETLRRLDSLTDPTETDGIVCMRH